ncbi:Guanine nucleotide exchange factor lte1 [Diplodia intermedia]|uniref:Guanine nucleotide exchange factor lte1 n=1 Tax=Diplodia intermedia TaxID=856260 RepID=A0ABR3TIK4_9PEZI
MSARTDVHPVSDGSREARPGVERGLSKVTMGSGSILIFDDTGAPPPLPLVMSGALPADESTTSAPSMAAAPETSRFDDALRQSGNMLGKDSLEATSRRGEPVVSLPPVTMHPDVIIQATAPTPTVNEISFYHDEVDSYETEPSSIFTQALEIDVSDLHAFGLTFLAEICIVSERNDQTQARV